MKPLSNTQLINHYGFNKYKLTDRMRNCMHIPTEMLLGLEVYRMIHMTGSDFKLSIVDGQIPYLDNASKATNYDVIYHGCNPFTAKRAYELRLSFRKCRDDFGDYAYVLVQIVNGMEGM